MPPRLLRDKAKILLKSAGVGAVATAADLLVLAVLVSGLGLSPRWASPVALALGLAVQFSGNKWYAFDDKSQRWARQLSGFLLIELVAFSANLALFDVAVRALPGWYLALRLATQALVYFCISLPLWSLLFRPSQRVAS